jgi:hypothetical protein
LRISKVINEKIINLNSLNVKKIYLLFKVVDHVHRI